jgi:hypothetical protein
LESFSSTAAAAKERVSATLAKIAKPSRSGSFDISNPETISFDNFYFQLTSLSIVFTPQRHNVWSVTMIQRRPFNQLATADHGWLKAKHHFAFGEFADPIQMGWGALRVWNDDEIPPTTGFPSLPHANMEITYVREVAIRHKDSLGNEGCTKAGAVQVMSVGSRIRHAEYNLQQRPIRIFQIRIMPTQCDGSPAWGSQPFPNGDRSGRLVTLASGIDRDTDALQSAPTPACSAPPLKAGESLDYALGTPASRLSGAGLGRRRGERNKDRATRRRAYQGCCCHQDHGH